MLLPSLPLPEQLFLENFHTAQPATSLGAVWSMHLFGYHGQVLGDLQDKDRPTETNKKRFSLD
jgi:hypothetical protein